MAVDTRDKRFSLVGFALPVLRVMANPDGSLDAPDRAQILFLYAGITLNAEAPAEPLDSLVRHIVRMPTYAIPRNPTENQR